MNLINPGIYHNYVELAVGVWYKHIPTQVTYARTERLQGLPSSIVDWPVLHQVYGFQKQIRKHGSVTQQ